MSLTATLVNALVLAGGRTQVRVKGSGIGRLRVGDDMSTWIVGSFNRVVSVRAAARIDVRFGFARVTLTPTLLPDPIPIATQMRATVEAPVVVVEVPIPNVQIAVRLFEQSE